MGGPHRAAYSEHKGTMSLFGVLANARGHRSLASGALLPGRAKRLSSDRLDADRLAAILEMLSDASPTAASSPLQGWDPLHTSGGRQPRHARARPSGLPVPVPVPVTVDSARLISANVIPAEVVLAPEILAPEVLAPAVRVVGRHRRPGVPAPVALRRARIGSHRLVLLGILVLLVAGAVVLGVRGSGALPSAQPRADAATYSGLAGR